MGVQMRWRAALLGVLIAFSAQGAFAASKLIYRIDSAAASVQHGILVVTASGAVQSGGWTNPLLILRRVPEADTLEVDFSATPPRSKRTVIQATLPVKATVKTALPHDGAVQVKLNSQTNSVTVPIVLPRHAASATTLLRPVRFAR
jgi:hypothetical protein